MNKRLRALLARRQQAVAQMSAISTAAADAENGMLTEGQRTEFDALQAEIAALDGDIQREQALIAATRDGAAVEIPNGRVSVTDNRMSDPTLGFSSFGEFAMAVRRAGRLNAVADERLVFDAAATGYQGEGSGADGGFLIPPQFSTEIMTAAYTAVESLVPLTDNIPLGESNGMTFPVDESTPWGGGIQAFWTGEGQQSQQSKGSVEPASLRLKKLTALIGITEEMQKDARAMGAYLQGKVPEAITWKTNEAFWSGDGNGKPLGMAKAKAIVVVSKEAGQAADSILLQNITKMRARCPATSYRRAIWMISHDALPQLDALAYATTATNVPIYNPVGGDYGYGTLLGRPVMVSPQCETVGDQGDIALVDWKKYRTITKAAGIETATSMHFWFDQGVEAFRAIFRIDGQPSVTKAITPPKGTNTLSPFVMLEAR